MTATETNVAIAAAATYAPIEFTSPADVAAIIKTNLTGPIRMAQAVLPVLRRQRSGRIVNVGSVAAEPKISMSSMGIYAAAKAGCTP